MYPGSSSLEFSVESPYIGRSVSDTVGCLGRIALAVIEHPLQGAHFFRIAVGPLDIERVDLLFILHGEIQEGQLFKLFGVSPLPSSHPTERFK